MLSIPRELEHLIKVILIPLPSEKEIKDILGSELKDNDEIVQISKGLEAVDIKIILRQVLSTNNEPEECLRVFNPQPMPRIGWVFHFPTFSFSKNFLYQPFYIFINLLDPGVINFRS